MNYIPLLHKYVYFDIFIHESLKNSFVKATIHIAKRENFSYLFIERRHFTLTPEIILTRYFVSILHSTSEVNLSQLKGQKKIIFNKSLIFIITIYTFLCLLQIEEKSRI